MTQNKFYHEVWNRKNKDNLNQKNKNEFSRKKKIRLHYWNSWYFNILFFVLFFSSYLWICKLRYTSKSLPASLFLHKGPQEMMKHSYPSLIADHKKTKNNTETDLIPIRLHSLILLSNASRHINFNLWDGSMLTTSSKQLQKYINFSLFFFSEL